MMESTVIIEWTACFRVGQVTLWSSEIWFFMKFFIRALFCQKPAELSWFFRLCQTVFGGSWKSLRVDELFTFLNPPFIPPFRQRGREKSNFFLICWLVSSLTCWLFFVRSLYTNTCKSWPCFSFFRSSSSPVVPRKPPPSFRPPERLMYGRTNRRNFLKRWGENSHRR